MALMFLLVILALEVLLVLLRFSPLSPLFIQVYRLSRLRLMALIVLLVLFALGVPSVLVCPCPSLLSFFGNLGCFSSFVSRLLSFSWSFKSLFPFTYSLLFVSFSIRDISTNYETLIFRPSQTGRNRSGTAGLAG